MSLCEDKGGEKEVGSNKEGGAAGTIVQIVEAQSGQWQIGIRAGRDGG